MRRYAKLGAVFTLGLLLGATGMMLHLGKYLDELVLVNQKLRERLTAINEELTEIQKSTRQQGVITAIDPDITFPANQLPENQQEELRLEIEQEIRKLLAPLKGRPVREVDYHMVPVAIDGRILELNGLRFKLHVRMVIVTTRLRVRVEVSQVDTLRNQEPAVSSSAAGRPK